MPDEPKAGPAMGGAYRYDPDTGELVPDLQDEAMRKRAEQAEKDQKADS